MPLQTSIPQRNDGRIIIHFDYDYFYAQVWEREVPTLRNLPLAVQQKQIIVTCNYEARRRGLHKLQLVKEARKKCPDVVIVLGEDLTRFRNASKELYAFLRTYAWSDKVEKLGFDEVFIDVTDMVDYNAELLNHHDLSACFFHLDRNNPSVGFSYDASSVAGHVFPSTTECPLTSPTSSSAPAIQVQSADLCLRLLLGSHLAQYLRHQVEEQRGYTSAVGISTNKLLSKLVGNLNKPKAQTTLMPPYSSEGETESNVTMFIDGHDIGKIPGIGLKSAHKIRDYFFGRPAAFDTGLVYGDTREQNSVKNIRLRADVGPVLLDKLLGGPGAPKGIGGRIWGLMHGIDNHEVCKAKALPQQISIEDSYKRLDRMEDVENELVLLAGSLIRRMRFELMSDIDDADDTDPTDEERSVCSPRTVAASSVWIAYPITLRLTTRPRLRLNPDGSREKNLARISKSCNMPPIIFNKSHSTELIAEKITQEVLIPLFRKLHPEQSGWNLSLVNICATNISPVATNHRDGPGRDISKMFKKQQSVSTKGKVDELDVAFSYRNMKSGRTGEQEDAMERSQVPTGNPQDDDNTQHDFLDDDAWEIEVKASDPGETCNICGAIMPSFARNAHERFHNLAD